jgi:hypothetical protein
MGAFPIADIFSSNRAYFCSDPKEFILFEGQK